MYEDKTPDNIKRAILRNVEESGCGLSAQEGDFADTNAGPIAFEISKFYNAMNSFRYIVWVNETSGEYLDLEAERIGILPRKEGAAARAVLKITGEPNYKIDKGTAFVANTEDDLFYDVENEVVIPESGEILAFATAREYGTKYNAPADTIIYQFTNDSSIENVTNPEPAIGGADTESDLSLYRRIQAGRQKPSTSGNKYDYEKWALEVPGVGFAVVLPLRYGNGTVKVIVADENRRPVDSEIVNDCYEHIANKRPIGPTVTIVSATSKSINISATLELEDNTDPTIDQSTYIANAQRDVKNQLEKHFAEMALMYNEVVYNWVGAVIINAENVKDYSNLLINDISGDIVLEEGEVPTVGEVVLS